MKIDLTLESPIARSFRVDQVGGLFDVKPEKKSRLELSVEVPGWPGGGPGGEDTSGGWGDWKIGAIVGPSGSGKSVIARRVYGQNFVEGDFDWPANASLLDGFPEELSMKDITGTLSAVGFSEPPAWVLPYRLLSNGQKMRCNLARALLAPAEAAGGVVAFDEFTSVVDRQVGRFASAAVAKAVRAGHVPAKRFVAVSCHMDVLEWLEPDWVLDMATRQLARGSLRRPEIRVEVHLLPPRGGQRLWPLFKRHHYLSAALSPPSTCYVATWEGSPIAFCATINNAGHRGRRIIHRVVVLPDFQGLGIGTRLLDAVASIETAAGSRVSIRTSHPALIAALKRRATWRAYNIMRRGKTQEGFSRTEGRRVGSAGRTTVSFSYSPQN